MAGDLEDNKGDLKGEMSQMKGSGYGARPVQTITTDEGEWMLLKPGNAPGTFEIPKTLIVQTLGAMGENDNLLAKFDKEAKTLTIKVATLKTRVEVTFK
jgi:hypothetical protein